MALIILAHPNYAQSVANRAVINSLQGSGLDLEIRPIAELYPDFQIDVAAEQQALLRHQTIVFQYPFYWYNMPAILKQWFDCVFTYGFAYGSAGSQLKGKNFVASFTVGAPEREYHTLGEHHFPVAEFCKNLAQTAYYARMNFVPPFWFHGTSPALYSADEIQAKACGQAAQLAAKLQALEAA